MNFEKVKFVETESNNLLDKFGISEERLDAIMNGLNEAQPKTIVEAFQVLGERAESQNEYVFGAFVLGQHFAPNPLEALLAQAAGGPKAEA